MTELIKMLRHMSIYAQDQGAKFEDVIVQPDGSVTMRLIPSEYPQLMYLDRAFGLYEGDNDDQVTAEQNLSSGSCVYSSSNGPSGGATGDGTD